jgi:hypothetical protein
MSSDNVLVTTTFGTIALRDDEAYLNATIELHGRVQPCSLFVGEGFAGNRSLCSEATRKIDDLGGLDQLARSRFTSPVDDETQLIASFVEFHVDELDADIQATLFGTTNAASLPLHELLQRLHIRGVGVHLKNGAVVINLDYSFGVASDELLVARFHGDELSIAHES